MEVIPDKPAMMRTEGSTLLADDGSIEFERQVVLDRILLSSGGIAIAGMFLHVFGSDITGIIAFMVTATAMLGLHSFKKWSLKHRSTGMMAVLYLLAWLSLANRGITSPEIVFLVALPPLAFFFLGLRAGIITSLVSIFSWLGAWLVFEVAKTVTLNPQPDNLNLQWFYYALNMLWMIVVLSQVQMRLRKVNSALINVPQQKLSLLEKHPGENPRLRQLEYENNLLNALLDNVSDKIFFKDLNGRYTRINLAVVQQYSVSPDQVVGKTDNDFFTPEYAQEIRIEEQKVLSTGEPSFEKIELETWRDNRPNTMAIKSRIPIKDDQGLVIGFYGTARDITEIKKAQKIVKHHADQLALVANVGRAVTSSLDINDLLRRMVELVKEGFAYYGVNVWLVTEPGDAVQLKAGFRPQGDDLASSGLQIPIQNPGLITQVCRSGELVLNNKFKSDKNLLLANHFPETQSLLILPLKVAEKTIGVLDIRSKKQDTFQETDVTLLRSLADQATVAIRNATLYQSEQTRRHFSERLYQISRALSSTIKLSEVTDLILQQFDQIVQSDRSMMLLVEKDSLQITSTRGLLSDSEPSATQLPIREYDIFNQIILTQQPISISDITQHPDWKKLSNLSLGRSWMGIPLTLYDKAMGMLLLTRESVNPFTLNEQSLAQAFAGQCALALENARLYENLENFNQQLEQMVQQRTEELQQAYAKLERLDSTKSKFIAVTSHELRTPVTVLRGYSQMLLDSPLIQNESSLLPLADGIDSGSNRLYEIVNSMLDIAKIDSRALQLSPVPLSLKIFIKSLAAHYAATLTKRNIQLSLEGMELLPAIEADSDALQKVFSQLISNAIKYTPDGGQVTISGRALKPDEKILPEGGVEIIVKDTGIGIDPSAHELVFTRFFQTGEVALHSTGKTKFKGGGPGLGLPIARGIIEAHQGRLWVESPGYDENLLPGSQFHVILPVRQRVTTPV